MANFLFKLGRGSARRPVAVIVSWVLALGLAGGAFLAFGGTLSDSFSIPGTETERVTGELAKELPDLNTASSRVVFDSTDGSPFSAEQQTQITAALTALTDYGFVAGVVDPFTTAQERTEQEQQLVAGAQQLEDGKAELVAAQDGVEEAQSQLDDAQAALDVAVTQAKDAGVYQDQQSVFQGQQDELDAQQQELDAQTDQVTAGLDKIAAQQTQLELGSQLAANAAALQTLSEDGATALAVVSFNQSMFALPQDSKDAVVQSLESAPIDGVDVFLPADLLTSVEGILGVGELAGVALALIVLMVMMRAIMPALQPIITSVIGVGVGVAAALAFSDVVDMSSVTPVLGVMLGLAVGIDYSLFIINRHRKQLATGTALHESIGLANGTSGNAVVFAGATVIVALLALNVTGVPFLGAMGSVAAFCVLVAVANAVTLTPALLSLMGTRALGKKARARIGKPAAASAAIKPMRTSAAILSLIATIAVLAVVAIPSASMRLGLPDGTQEPVESTQYQAYKTIGEQFGEGLNGTLLVTAALPEPLPEDAVLAQQVALSDALMAQDSVVAVAPGGVSADRDFLVFQVIPADGPSSISTENLVHQLRGMSPLEDGTTLGVAGEASGNIDVSQKLSDALPLYLAVVVGLSLIILIVVFRSLLVPLMATLGFVLSLFAAFGAVTAVYQWGWLSDIFGVHDPGPVLNFLPIILTGILFGLAMDYQLFLATGMREAWVHGAPAREAIVAGRRHGRAVVTAAAIIMAAVFGGFVFSEIAMIRPMGFGLAAGVLFDAFLVRMLLLPALMHLVGEGAWWLPAWLEKILPNVDVEGAELREHSVTEPAGHHSE